MLYLLFLKMYYGIKHKYKILFSSEIIKRACSYFNHKAQM